MAINARNKGKRGEREIIDALQPHVDEVADFVGVDRPQLQRNTLQSDKGGYDIVGLPGFALEVKRVENDIPSAVAGWWKQAVRQAYPDLEPVLLWRVNGGKWKVKVFARLDLPDGKRYKIPADISFDNFVFWMKARLFGHLSDKKKALDGTPPAS